MARYGANKGANSLGWGVPTTLGAVKYTTLWDLLRWQLLDPKTYLTVICDVCLLKCDVLTDRLLVLT